MGTIGRPSKGARDAIIMRPTLELGETIRTRARELLRTPGEYVVLLVAEHLGVPEYAPPASLKPNVQYRPVAARRGTRDTIVVKPSLPFGRILKTMARDADLSYGNYLVALVQPVLTAPRLGGFVTVSSGQNPTAERARS